MDSGYADYFKNYTAETGVNTGVIQYLYYFIAFTIIVVLLLVLIHFAVSPIFRTRPGAPGYIPLPGSNDSEVYWEKPQAIRTLTDTETSLGTKTFDYSVILDIQVDNPTANTDYPRILFSRGELIPTPTEPYTNSSTILSIAPNYNLLMYLDRMTNDLNVSVQTSVSGQGGNIQVVPENITIPNLPVGKAVRIGIMVGNGMFEVYVNGYLLKTKTFANSIRSVRGNCQPPFDNVLSATARVRNLRLWGRPLAASEFRAYGGADDMDRKGLPDSCAA
jgi:hypothetical protein